MDEKVVRLTIKQKELELFEYFWCKDIFHMESILCVQPVYNFIIGKSSEKHSFSVYAIYGAAFLVSSHNCMCPNFK